MNESTVCSTSLCPEAYLDMEAWRSLAGDVMEYRPTRVVLLARKMARLWQYLRAREPKTFPPEMPITSNFALEYMPEDKIAGERFAIIDDAFNVGSTMEHICTKLESAGARDVQCFVVARKQPDAQTGAAFRWPLHVARPQALTDHEYHAHSAKISMALLLGPHPLELEFPVYALEFSDGIDAFQAALGAQKDFTLQWLTHPEAKISGMERLSLYPKGPGDNTKIRLYFDRCANRTFAVPMPGSFMAPGASQGAAQRRLFAMGQELMEACRGLLEKYGMRTMTPETWDERLLFGKDAREVPAEGVGAETKNAELESYLLPALRHCRTFMEAMEAYENRESLRLVFVKLLQELGKAVGEDDPAHMAQDFLDALPESLRRQLRDERYARLRIGATFAELAELAAMFWTGAAACEPSGLRAAISRLLDEHIDQGFVVPVLDLAMRRAFRKGEPFPHDRALLYALRCQGRDVSAGDDLEEALRALRPLARKRCLDLLAGLEEEDVR